MELGLMSLDKLVAQHRQKHIPMFDLRELENFAFRFVELFAKLEEMKISHRDIKPANFIVVRTEPLECKLTDFGLCKAYQQNESAHHELAGSYFYMSPQLKLIYKNPRLKTTYSLVKNDVYSFGVTLYELACF
jgi:serine/threonine protein kinase